jgi:hypothetical protein
MNYRDVVLRLLKKRNRVNVVEEIMLADFSTAADPHAAFEKWCTMYYIEIKRTPGIKTIVLEKRPKPDKS